MLTVSVPVAEGSAHDVAVMVTPGGLGTVAGATYAPVDALMVPHGFPLPVQAVPLTVQVTTWLVEAGATVAVNVIA